MSLYNIFVAAVHNLQYIFVLLINSLAHLKSLARVLAANPKQKRIDDNVFSLLFTMNEHPKAVICNRLSKRQLKLPVAIFEMTKAAQQMYRKRCQDFILSRQKET